MARGRRRHSPVHGVLVVDKPSGPTSHDVVARVRRAVGTRVVGHAGTLDPMATGVLVVAIGEATKLVPYLTADDKRYTATIALGRETDSLDAGGETTGRAPVPVLGRAEWQALADGFLGEHDQQVPRVSAVRVDGERLHVRARRGESFEPPTRRVTAHALAVTAVHEAAIEVCVHCAKGFFVRSWARDLARRAGTRGHLVALRRGQSGSFGLAEAVGDEALSRARDDAQAREQLLGAVVPLAEACRRVLPVVEVGEVAAQDMAHGRPVNVARCRPEPPGERPLAVLGAEGQALAVARRDGDRVLVVRGFRLDQA